LLSDQAFVFDVDGNHGEHTTTFLSLEARCVVAMEPPGDLAKSILISIPDEVALALPVFGRIQIERR